MNSKFTSQREDSGTLYSSAFSELTYDQEKSLIIATWKENSKKLVESGVIDEISRVLDYVNMHDVRHVVVDARLYTFTQNSTVQEWINTRYVPRLMESSVIKYGFVVNTIPGDRSERDPDVSPYVEYFTDIDEALNWITIPFKP
jgi:hypothetical protein